MCISKCFYIWKEKNIKFITVKLLNRGHLGVLKDLSVVERCPQLGGNLKKIVTFGTKHFVHYSWHVRYLGYLLLGGFTVHSIYEGLNSFLSNETLQKMCPMVRKNPHLSPLLKNRHLQMTLELKPRIGKFSLL